MQSSRLAKDSRTRNYSAMADLDISAYAHQNSDRFGVLLDLWASEVAFQEAKKEVMFHSGSMVVAATSNGVALQEFIVFGSWNT